MKIALDAMGGDYAPAETVKGAVLAQREEKDLTVILAGDEKKLAGELKKYYYHKDRLLIKHAGQIIEMGEHPVSAIRKKKDASIVVAAKLVKDGEAQGFISAGNTGAAMTVSQIILGKIKGVDRPAIASPLPKKTGKAVLVDAGATIDCKPNNLLNFAVLGSQYAKILLNIESPRVGLLNIGEEETKGNSLYVNSYKLLAQCPLINFTGNIEGKDVFRDSIDVVVCDGFEGNIVLKTAEGVGELIMSNFKEEIGKSFCNKIGAFFLKSVFRKLKKRLDYAEYGGALLLGVQGICVISHGRSNSLAIKNALLVAYSAAKGNLIQLINDSLEKLTNESLTLNETKQS